MTDTILLGFIGGSIGALLMMGALNFFMRSTCKEFQQAKRDMWKTAALINAEANIKILQKELKTLKKDVYEHIDEK